jgi:hypothetical protein
MFEEISTPGLNNACTTDANGILTAPKQSVATHSNTIKTPSAIKPIKSRRKTNLQVDIFNLKKAKQKTV